MKDQIIFFISMTCHEFARGLKETFRKYPTLIFCGKQMNDDDQTCTYVVIYMHAWSEKATIVLK